jgi:hypothetical protein
MREAAAIKILLTAVDSGVSAMCGEAAESVTQRADRATKHAGQLTHR